MDWKKHREGYHEGNDIIRTERGTYCRLCMDDLFNSNSPDHSKKIKTFTLDPCSQNKDDVSEYIDIGDDDDDTKDMTLTIDDKETPKEKTDDIQSNDIQSKQTKKTIQNKKKIIANPPNTANQIKSNRNRKRKKLSPNKKLSPHSHSYSHIQHLNASSPPRKKRKKTHNTNISKSPTSTSNDTNDNDENDDDEEITNLYATLTENDMNIYKNYKSDHGDINKKWKLFTRKDYDIYGLYGIQARCCSLDGCTFQDVLSGKTSHFVNKKAHQIALLYYCISNGIPLPSHIKKITENDKKKKKKKSKKNTMDNYFNKNKKKSTLSTDNSSRKISNVQQPQIQQQQIGDISNVIQEKGENVLCLGFPVKNKNILKVISNYLIESDKIFISQNSFHHKRCPLLLVKPSISHPNHIYFDYLSSFCRNNEFKKMIQSEINKIINDKKNLPYNQKGICSLIDSLNNKDSYIDKIKMKQLNKNRHLMMLKGKNLMLSQLLIQVKLYGNGASILLKQYLDGPKSLNLICKQLKYLNEHGIKLKTYDDEGFKNALYLYSIVGAKAYEHNHKVNAAPSRRACQNALRQQKQPLITDIFGAHHIISTFNNDKKQHPQNHRYQAWNIGFDGFYGDKIVQLDAASNKFCNLCVEHKKNSIPTYFNVLSDALNLRRGINDEFIHIADQHVSIVINSISHIKNDELSIKILPAIPTCGKYSGDVWYHIFMTTLKTLNDDSFVRVYGPTLCLGVDGCTQWHPILKYIRTKHGSIPNDWSSRVDSRIYGKTLYKLTALARDLRHLCKNIRGSVISINGSRLLGVQIAPGIIGKVFVAACYSQSFITDLFDIKDRQNVDKALEFWILLHDHLSLPSNYDIIHRKLVLKHSGDSIAMNMALLYLSRIRILSEAMWHIITATFFPGHSLRKRLLLITYGAFVLKTIYSVDGQAAFSGDFMYGIVSYVGSIYNAVYRMQNDGQLKSCELLFIYLGSELNERTHCLVRCSVVNHRQINQLFVHDRLPRINYALKYEAANPSKVLHRKRNKIGDKINYESLKNDNLYVMDVDLKYVASEGIDMALREMSKYLRDDTILLTLNLTEIMGQPLNIINGINIMEMTNVEMIELENDWNDYKISRSVFMNDTSSGNQEKYLQILDKLQSDYLSDKEKQQIIIDDIMKDHNDYYEQKMDEHEYYLNETAATLEQQLNDEIADNIDDNKKRYCLINEKQTDGTFKEMEVHKTSIMTTLFNEQNVQYYDVRNFNTKRIAKKGGDARKGNIISTEINENIVTSGSVGIGLFKTDKKATTSCPALFVVIKIKNGNKISTEIDIDKIDDDTVFIAKYATRVVIKYDDDDDEDDDIALNEIQKYLFWYGLCDKGSKINLNAKYVAFPAWKSKEDQNIIIYEPLSAIRSYTKSIFNQVISKKKTINEMPVLSASIKKALEFEQKEYPYIDSLLFKFKYSIKDTRNPQNTQNTQKKQGQDTKNNAKGSKKEKLRGCSTNTMIKCTLCDDGDEDTLIAINDCVYHQLFHRVKEIQKELEQEDDDDDDDDDIEIIYDDTRCYICGSTGKSQCNLDAVFQSNGKVIIKTDCLPPNTHVPFKSVKTITDKSSSSAWNNPIVSCCKCKGDKSPKFWKWNMENHELCHHQEEDVTVKISDFEIEIIPLLQDKKGKCRKSLKNTDFKYLCIKYPSEMNEIYKDQDRYTKVIADLAQENTNHANDANEQ